jgi:Family of unknown function (DUF6441)
MPDLPQILSGIDRIIERATTKAMREATADLKCNLREDVVAAGLGSRLAKTWRGRTYPEHGDSLEAVAYVWSKAPKIIDAFDRGVTIRSSRGLFLAIPTEAANHIGRGLSGKRERITPGGWERRTGLKLRFVYRRGRASLLVLDNARLTKRGHATANRRKSGTQTVVVFILVPQVSLKKRLDIDRVARSEAAKLPDLIARQWKG